MRTKKDSKPVPTAEQLAEGFCPKRKDKTHCVHWWDGDKPCCACGDNTDPQKSET